MGSCDETLKGVYEFHQTVSGGVTRLSRSHSPQNALSSLQFTSGVGRWTKAVFTPVLMRQIFKTTRAIGEVQYLSVNRQLWTAGGSDTSKAKFDFCQTTQSVFIQAHNQQHEGHYVNWHLFNWAVKRRCTFISSAGKTCLKRLKSQFNTITYSNSQ